MRLALPDSYTLKTGSPQAYFDAMLDAQPPERVFVKFLENLGFTSTNDRLFMNWLGRTIHECVNPASAGWVWMPTATLIKGMRTFDTVEDRGYTPVQ